MAEPRSVRVNGFGVLVALVLLGVAVTALVGRVVWLGSTASHWGIAAVIAGLGLLLLVSGGRRRS